MKTSPTLEKGRSRWTRPRRSRLIRWILLGCLVGLRSISRWLRSVYLGHSSTQPLSATLPRLQPSPLRRTPPGESMPFYSDEPPQYRGRQSSPSNSPRSLHELSPEQLELALSVVHQQLHSHPLLAIWSPPPELSLLPQTDWLCLIEVWDQLQRQRRQHPLH